MSAAEQVFLDTNVLVYAHDRGEPVKGSLAVALLGRLFLAGTPAVSIQVFSEFYQTVTRKLSAPLSHQEAADELRRFRQLTRVVSLDWAVLERAVGTIQIHSLSLWDAQIHAAAKEAGSLFILSEDFQHRRVLDGVIYLNPFAVDFDITEILPP